LTGKGYNTDEERLLAKKVQLKLLNKFNFARFQFVGSIGLIVAYILFRSRKSIQMKIIPVTLLVSLGAILNYYAGMYGVYRNIDELFETILLRDDSYEIVQETREFLEKNKFAYLKR